MCTAGAVTTTRLATPPRISEKDVEKYGATPVCEREKAQPAPPANQGPPWWGWFGLVIVLAGIAGLTIAQFA